MANQTDKGPNHNATVRQVIEAAHNTWQALLQLQAADDINPDGVFVPPRKYGDVHPQKQVHARLLGYHQLIANKTYTIRAQDMWTEQIVDESGHPYMVEVPAEETVHVNGDDLSLTAIDTEVEPLTLETLHYRWGMRYITVQHSRTGSYGRETGEVEQRRIWMPPRAMQLAFEQLEDVRAKIGFGADLPTPDYHEKTVLDPTEGVREPYEDQA